MYIGYWTLNNYYYYYYRLAYVWLRSSAWVLFGVGLEFGLCLGTVQSLGSVWVRSRVWLKFGYCPELGFCLGSV